MNFLKQQIEKIIMLISGVLMISSIAIWAPVCQKPLELFRKNGDVKYMAMKCRHTSKLLIYLSIILIVMAIISMIKNKRPTYIPVVIGVMMLVSVNHKYGIGMCKTGIGMECEATRTWIYICGALAIISGVIAIWKEKKLAK